MSSSAPVGEGNDHLFVPEEQRKVLVVETLQHLKEITSLAEEAISEISKSPEEGKKAVSILKESVKNLETKTQSATNKTREVHQLQPGEGFETRGKELDANIQEIEEMITRLQDVVVVVQDRLGGTTTESGSQEVESLRSLASSVVVSLVPASAEENALNLVEIMAKLVKATATAASGNGAEAAKAAES